MIILDSGLLFWAILYIVCSITGMIDAYRDNVSSPLDS